MKKRLLAGLLAITLLFTNLGVTSYAEKGVASDSVSENQMLLSEEGAEVITDYAGLAAALANGGTYTIEGEISTDRPELDKPLIVEKDVTFKGGTISLDYGGILLGANATFEGTDLKFNNFAYMGIFANGHELNLSDSTIQWNGQDPFSIVAGGVKNNPLFSAAEGLEAKIDLRDVTFSNEKGEDLAVYAGNVYNISPEVVGGTAQPIGEAGYEKPVTITVGDINGAKATVYGRGAAYTGSKLGDANGTLAVYDKIYVTNECTTNENVHIIIENPEDITCVDGATGLAGEIYVGARLTVAPVDSTQKTLAAKNLGSISLDTKNSREGKVSVKLTNDGVTGFYPTADMNIPENTILDISDMMYSMIIDRLSGGGKLILGLDQILTITGQVSQTTGVAIEKFFADSYETGGTAIGGYSYIEAANSTENSFYFIPEEGSDMEFIFSEGVWTTSGSSEVEILEKIVSIEAAQEEVRVAVGEATIYDDLTIEWEEQALYCQLGYLPMNLLYNDSGEGIIRSEDEYGYYGYTFSIGEQEYLVGVTESQISFQPSLPEGTHKFTFKIPAEYVTTNEEKQFSFTMIVGDGIGQLPPEKGTGTATVTMSDRTYGEEASLPNVVSDTNDIKDAIFTYSGTKADGSEYGPSLQMPEEAGSYQVEAVLLENENYKEAKATAEFVIRKRELQIQNVIIVDKYYDGTTEAGIISLTITDELSQPVVLSEGSDYQLQAAFTTAEIGNNKEVTVTVTLLNNNYSLENNTYQTTANILEEIKGEEGGESGNPDEGGEDGNPDEEEIPAVVPEDLWVEGIQDYDYSGKTIVQKELKVYHGNQQLVLNKDYTVKYKNNQKAGVATITITGKGNYAGTIVKNFEIKPLNLSEAILSDEVVTLVYNKKVQKAVTTVSYELQGKIIKLKSGKDFEFVYPGTDSAKTGEYDAKAFQAVNENPGYTVYIKGKGNYTGERTFLQKITEKTLISKVSFIKIKDQKYSETVQITGEAKPEVVLKDKGVELRQKAEGATGNDYDYTVEYRNNKSVGTATIIIKANENSEKYAGTRIVTFKITGTPISKVKIDGFVASKIWTGEEITQKVSLLPNIKGNTTPLQEGEDKDYIVSYSNNIEVGKATVIFTGKGGYTGTVKKTFKITGSPINKVGVEGLPDIPVEYAGKAIELEGVWLRNSEGRILTEVGEDGKGDYAVSYKNNHKAGTSTITFTGKNGYTGKLSKTFKIVASDMNSDKIQVQLENDYPYSKGGAQPEPTVICGWGENAVILTKGVDYTLSYANNKAVTDENSKKDPMVTITGKGGFKGKLIKNFIITEGNLSQVSAKVTDVVYKKKSNICKPTIVLTDSNGKKLIAGTDYDKRITYSYKTGGIVQSYEIIPQGTKILARINGINNYAGTVKTVEFSYVKSLLSKASVTILPQAYSGQEVTLKEEDIEVKIGNDTLVLGTDYEIVGYTNNRGKGTAKVTLRGIGNYGGEKTVSFKIESKNMNYTILFYKNGTNVTGTMKNMVIKESTRLSANTFKRNGYSFKGWNTKADGTGKLYTNQELFVLEADGKSYGGRITLYAQWEIIIYTITYHLADGDVSLLDPVKFPKTYTVEDEILLEPAYEKEEREFLGWYTDSKMTPSKAVTMIKKGSYGDKNFYGGWKETFIPQVEEPEEYLDLRDYNIIPNDGINDAEAIERALRAASYNAAQGGVNTVYLPAGVYNITPQHAFEEGDPGISMMSNTNLIMDRNAILLVEATNLQDYCVIGVQNKQNVLIQGGQIRGERYSHTGSGGEGGHGIGVYGSTNITISGVSIKENWGDGIYLGTKRVFSDFVGCNNITIKDCEIYRNRRSNISVVDADNLTIDHCLIYDAYGTAPQAGINIEPNSNSSGDKVNRNITIQNSEIRAYENRLNDSEHRAFITLYNPYDNNYKSGENIKFINCTIIGWFGNYSGYNLSIDAATRSKMQGTYVNMK